MARLVLIGMALTLSTAAATAQPPGERQNPWQTDELRPAGRDFTMPGEHRDGAARPGSGSRIFAGEELMPNGVIGFGMFGEKAERSPHSRSIARELTLPKQRKAAVGFLLKF